MAQFYHFYGNAKNSSGMERYWLCSSKFAIFVPDDIPLWTAYSCGSLSLQAQIDNSPYVGFCVSYILLNEKIFKYPKNNFIQRIKLKLFGKLEKMTFFANVLPSSLTCSTTT